jgi:hypothetical protein
MTQSPGTEHADGDGVSRRWLIRGVVGLGVGIPVAVESVTLFSLVESKLLGGGSEDADAAATTTDREPTPVGGELLPATAPADTLAAASVQVSGSTWVFELTAEVENTSDTPYELQLGAVTTRGGDTVAGQATTGRIDPGDTGRVTTTWELSDGETPASVAVTGVTYTDDGPEREPREVPLGNVPVEG